MRGERESDGGVEDQAQQGSVCVHQDLSDSLIIPGTRVVHMEKYSFSRCRPVNKKLYMYNWTTYTYIQHAHTGTFILHLFIIYYLCTCTTIYTLFDTCTQPVICDQSEHLYGTRVHHNHKKGHIHHRHAYLYTGIYTT